MAEGGREKGDGQYFIRCIFHEDDGLNCSINVTQLNAPFNCLGCGLSGSIIEWYCHQEGLSPYNAMERLQERYYKPDDREPRQLPAERSSLGDGMDSVAGQNYLALFEQNG